MNLSEHFTLEEMTSSQTAVRSGIDNSAPPEIVERLKVLCEGLEKVRHALGDRPITISSGYRCPALNRAVGGAVASAHMQGYAADIECPAFGDPYAVCQAIKASGIRFNQMIHEYGGWCHIDFSPSLAMNEITIFQGGGYKPGILTREQYFG